MAQALVLGEVGHALGAAMACQVGRGGCDHHAVGAQRAGHQAFIDDGANAHRHVETLARHVHYAVGQLQVHAHLRVGEQEVGHQWCDHLVAQRERRAHAQQALGHGAVALHGRLGPAHLLQHAPAVFIERGAHLGQAMVAGAALHQARAQVGFELADVFAHHHGRNVELARGSGKATGLDHGDHDFHVAQLVHGD